MKNQQTQQVNLDLLDQRKDKPKSKHIPKLNLQVKTWQKQSHGLFDYQSPPDKISKENISIQQSARIFRNIITRKTQIRYLKDETKDLSDRIEIFNVKYVPNSKCYILRNSLSTQLDQVMLGQHQEIQNIVEKHKLFISLKFEPEERHKLSIGDFIKLGRVQLVVLQINDSKKTQSLDFKEIYGARQYIFHLKQQLQGCCKVCLSDEATQEDPLVNPCNCRGSCGVIHLHCLKNWINNKVKKQFLLKVKTYNFEKFSCQICKAPFPTMIKLENGNQIFLLNFQRPTTPYILLEQCSQTQQKQAKTLHFIFPQEGQKVSIGRGQVCQLQISDISVSRNHSSMTYENNHFYIYDNNSKFGTLIELKKDIELKKSVNLQHNGCSLKIQPQKEQKKERVSKSGAKKSIPKKLSN